MRNEMPDLRYVPRFAADDQLFRALDRPGLPPFHSTRCRIARSLSAAWKAYAGARDPQGRSISLESATLLSYLCDAVHPRVVLDLGAGFNTYTFRTYAERAPECTVLTVDNEEAWLTQTWAYLELEGLSTEEMYPFAEFKADPLPGDLVFYGMGDMEFRAAHAGWALSMTKPGGFCVFSDIHDPEYRPMVEAVCAERSLCLWDLKAQTLDERGRYAGLIRVEE